MKKLILFAFVFFVTLLQFCTPGRKAQKATPKVTYTAHVQPVITAHCSPCHIPPKGNKEALHTFDGAKKNIDESIRRIQLNPTDKGFMPFKHPKLPDSTIQVFVQWKADGLLEN